MARWPAVSERPAATMELGDKAEVIGVAGSAEKRGMLEGRLTKPAGQGR